jgi:transcriptional regulator with XRE-family HTH domain
MTSRPSPLRLRRIVRGLRLRDVQAATGLLEVRISQLERGECRLAGPRLTKLATFYKCEPSQLIDEMSKWCTRTGRPFLGPQPPLSLELEEPPESAA